MSARKGGGEQPQNPPPKATAQASPPSLRRPPPRTASWYRLKAWQKAFEILADLAEVPEASILRLYRRACVECVLCGRRSPQGLAGHHYVTCPWLQADGFVQWTDEDGQPTKLARRMQDIPDDLPDDGRAFA